MLIEALKAEVDDYLERQRCERDEQGHALVVCNGRAQTRNVTLGAGTVELSRRASMTAGVMSTVSTSAALHTGDDRRTARSAEGIYLRSRTGIGRAPRAGRRGCSN
jgi:hypothetical protein